MSPESAAAKTARLEAQMTSVLEDARRDRETTEMLRSALGDFRSLLADVSMTGQTNTVRIRGVEEDITEMKTLLRSVATKEDVQRLETSQTGRQQMSTARFASVLLLMGTLGSALIVSATQILQHT